MNKVRVRFPPSPTGYLHIGGLRTALYNYCFAKQHGGTFILRIEDTDRERYVEGGVEAIITALHRSHISYEEGPILKDGHLEQVGDFGPYVQSERLNLYKKYADDLLASGHAYHCFCTSEELEALRTEQQLQKLPTKYNRKCLNLTKVEIDERLAKLTDGDDHVIRMHVPEGETVLEDIIRGKIVIKNNELDDQVLMKSDGFPTYHLANVVDDHTMEVSHVIRGEEWISSTPKHILLYQMFGWEAPQFAHLPLLLNADHSKLSKRQGDVAVEDYLDKGYLPEALLNFVALMGYNPKGDQELYSLQELVDLFDLSKVNPSGAVVNFDKLKWMNEHYIRQKSADELMELVKPFLDKAGKTIEPELLKRVLDVEKQRLTTLADIVEHVDGYVQLASYEPTLLVWKKADATDAKANLTSLKELLEGLNESQFASMANLEEAIKAHIAEKGLSNGNVLWPLRVSLSGSAESPGPFELAWALGKDEVLRRIDTAIQKLG